MTTTLPSPPPPGALGPEDANADTNLTLTGMRPAFSTECDSSIDTGLMATTSTEEAAEHQVAEHPTTTTTSQRRRLPHHLFQSHDPVARPVLPDPSLMSGGGGGGPQSHPIYYNQPHQSYYPSSLDSPSAADAADAATFLSSPTFIARPPVDGNGDYLHHPHHPQFYHQPHHSHHQYASQHHHHYNRHHHHHQPAVFLPPAPPLPVPPQHFSPRIANPHVSAQADDRYWQSELMDGDDSSLHPSLTSLAGGSRPGSLANSPALLLGSRQSQHQREYLVPSRHQSPPMAAAVEPVPRSSRAAIPSPYRPAAQTAGGDDEGEDDEDSAMYNSSMVLDMTDRLPSYEELIIEALCTAPPEMCTEPPAPEGGSVQPLVGGLKPQAIYARMEEKYRDKLPPFFKPSATQALKKSMKRSVLIRVNHFYYYNSAYEGPIARPRRKPNAAARVMPAAGISDYETSLAQNLLHPESDPIPPNGNRRRRGSIRSGSTTAQKRLRDASSDQESKEARGDGETANGSGVRARRSSTLSAARQETPNSKRRRGSTSSAPAAAPSANSQRRSSRIEASAFYAPTPASSTATTNSPVLSPIHGDWSAARGHHVDHHHPRHQSHQQYYLPPYPHHAFHLDANDHQDPPSSVKQRKRRVSGASVATAARGVSGWFRAHSPMPYLPQPSPPSSAASSSLMLYPTPSPLPLSPRRRALSGPLLVGSISLSPFAARSPVSPTFPDVSEEDRTTIERLAALQRTSADSRAGATHGQVPPGAPYSALGLYKRTESDSMRHSIPGAVSDGTDADSEIDQDSDQDDGDTGSFSIAADGYEAETGEAERQQNHAQLYSFSRDATSSSGSDQRSVETASMWPVSAPRRASCLSDAIGLEQKQRSCPQGGGSGEDVAVVVGDEPRGTEDDPRTTAMLLLSLRAR
ncbi:hypothetical protein BC828DRAFT_404274 [Blastocladiella britannica]|nr:hypothetical protein BC828DRAFT_404274 [Blastocladiella britannica]